MSRNRPHWATATRGRRRRRLTLFFAQEQQIRVRPSPILIKRACEWGKSDAEATQRKRNLQGCTVHCWIEAGIVDLKWRRRGIRATHALDYSAAAALFAFSADCDDTYWGLRTNDVAEGDESPP